MCTAITFQTKDHYFGRTLDIPFYNDEQVLIVPRHFPLKFRCTDPLYSHYALIGIGIFQNETPLFYDAVNEIGLNMAALRFSSVYQKEKKDRINVASFELIPFILGQCATVQDAKMLLSKIQLCDFSFSRQLPAEPLHWLLSDQRSSAVIECTAEKLLIYDNPAGILANNPSFDKQLFTLNQYCHLSGKNGENHFPDELNLSPYSMGMGSLGLPGDFSSCSRFARAAFAKFNARCPSDDTNSITQFFHMMETVQQPRGCNEYENGQFQMTQYTSCCNTDKAVYYYTTYDNHQITAVHMRHENLEKDRLICYPLLHKQQIRMQN